MKHVVSVSLGSSARDTDQIVRLLGEEVRIERRGVDGDLAAARRLVAELDGRVDAIGLGGLDLFVQVADRRYRFREAAGLAAAAPRTPVVCGAGLKDTLERLVVRRLADRLGWRDRRVLLVSGVDRFGMAAELEAQGADVLYGDLFFVLGVKRALRDPRTVERLARLLLPVVGLLPFRWIYPQGAAQEAPPSAGAEAWYAWAEVVAGDWHLIRRYAPARLDGKTVLTNTTTDADVAWLRERGARAVITTTPRFAGRSLATNLLEAALVAVAGRHPLPAEAYEELVERAGLEPSVVELEPPPSPSG